jgi:peptidoglycan/LPS O-acetylase OafA/YrhL
LWPIALIAHAGWIGVQLFFVLSGFLITRNLLDTRRDANYLRSFYVRRALRIFPLYFLTLFVGLVVLPHFVQLSAEALASHHHQIWLWTFLSNWAQPYGVVVSGFSHFWSLAVEEQFYLVWPLVVFFIRDRSRLLWACLALSSAALLLRFSLAFHHTIYHTINRSTLCRADSLLMGAALALLLRSQLHDAVLRSAKRVFFLVVALVAALNLARPIIERRPDWLFAFDASYLSLRYTLMALGSAALIAWCLRPTSVPRRLFENGALRFFGKYSYGLYVLHVVALGFLLKTFRGWIALVTPSKLAAVAGSGFLVFLVAVVAAYASYNLFEKQFLRLKRYFDYDRPRAPKVAIKV